MFRTRLIYCLVAFFFSIGLSAQGKHDTDSLVRLLSCDMLKQVESYGCVVRQALGNARFEHNGALLLCDTALWNVDSAVINAFGNVRIIQDETVLSSDKLDYLINMDVAQFRGTLVELQDKEANTLRTRCLDYNTRDSVGVFQDGGSLRDAEGQVIESLTGTYDSKISTFFFNGNVNMYTDSIFVKTDHIEYNTDTDVALFGSNTNAWKDDNMISSMSGWYDRNREIFLFKDNVHLLTLEQEAWSDSLKYYRNTNDAEMFGSAQVLDTTRNVSAVAGHMAYEDSLGRITLTRDPAVIGIVEQENSKDTVYLGADKLVYTAVPKCDIPEQEFKSAETRLQELGQDAITAYRKNAAEQARAAAEEARKKMEEDDPNAFGSIDRGKDGGKAMAKAVKTGGEEKPEPKKDTEAAPAKPEAAAKRAGRPAEVKDAPSSEGRALGNVTDSLSTSADSSSMTASLDSAGLAAQLDSAALASQLDSAAAPKDSTKFGFVTALRNVKLFKSDIQMACDSLVYNDIDSLARLFLNPIVWNDGNRQYSADSITVMARNGKPDRASLMSNAFITVQEDTLSYDQIKAAEMMAYFDTSGALRRFDAMGGASGLFFIEEQDTLATVNKFEAKMFMATLKDGSLDDLNYFDGVKSDAYPVVQMKKDDKFLKGYNWSPELRPNSPADITSLVPKKSERAVYEAIPRAEFKETEIYFPGYMDGVHEMISRSDSLKRERRIRHRQVSDSLARVDALRADSLALADSLAIGQGADSLLTSADSTLNVADSLASKDSLASRPMPAVDGVSDKVRLKADAKAEREKAREARAAKKRERWDELDRRDAEKAARKAERKLKKKRAETLKTLKALEKQEEKERKVFERYKAMYEKRKAREDARSKSQEKSVEAESVL